MCYYILSESSIIFLHSTWIEILSNNFGFRWFYEGRNGWWEYDVRTGQDLEQSFKQGEASCEMLIAGFLYIIDFQNMFQVIDSIKK
jgi:hypothetical protein